MIYLRAGLAPLLRDGRSNLPQCNCVTSGTVQIIISMMMMMLLMMMMMVAMMTMMMAMLFIGEEED